MNWNQISWPAVTKWAAAAALAQWYGIAATSRSMLLALITLMFLDYFTGLISGYLTKKIDSAVGFRGLANKGLILVLLLACHVVEGIAGLELHLEVAGALAFSVNEMISIVENCARSGVPIPGPFLDVLIAVKKLKASPATAEQLQALGMKEVTTVHQTTMPATADSPRIVDTVKEVHIEPIQPPPMA